MLQTAALISLMHHRELLGSGFFDRFGLPQTKGLLLANVHYSHWKCQYCELPLKQDSVSARLRSGAQRWALKKEKAKHR